VAEPNPRAPPGVYRARTAMAPAEPPDLAAELAAAHQAAARRDLPALLAMLAALDGAEEVEVVRAALRAGVSYDVAVGEVQREVERRLERRLRTEQA
jgi:hypothetical protein